MKWYDLFSSFYDNALEKLYYESRKKAVEYLNLANEQNVLDVACGTGANFKHIKAINNEVIVYGTDFSEGMLKKAQSLIKQNKWENIFLFQHDIRFINLSSIQKFVKHDGGFDKIICALGFSVFPEWELVLDNLLDLLKPDGRIVIMDVFAEKRSFNTWLVEKIAKADLNRKIWQTLELKTNEFSCEYLPVKESKVGGKLFIATGIKRK